GIPERLKAFRILLRRFPELRHKVTLLQVVVPSREEIPNYKELRREVELLVSQINGEFTEAGWVPIHYMHRNLTRKQLLAYYRTADIALVTSLKDGMNLVAKEFCAAQVDERGVVVISEFAGAAAELQHGALALSTYCRGNSWRRNGREPGHRDRRRRDNSHRPVPLQPRYSEWRESPLCHRFHQTRNLVHTND